MRTRRPPSIVTPPLVCAPLCLLGSTRLRLHPSCPLVEPTLVQIAHRLAEVHPDPSIIDQDILHFEVSLRVSNVRFVLIRRANSEVLTSSAFSLLSNSMKAYCRLSPVALSLMTSQLRILPNREKKSSRSSLLVTGFSLQTKRMFSGGRTSANGKSPTISNVNAAAFVSASRLAFSFSSSVLVSSICSSSPSLVEVCAGGVGGLDGMSRPSGSGNGSSAEQQEHQLRSHADSVSESHDVPKISTCRIRMSCNGLPAWSVNAALILSSVPPGS